MKDVFLFGYDLMALKKFGISVPIHTSVSSHLIVVGGSGSGKSTSILYWLTTLPPCTELYICDFKKSGEFAGISSHFAEFEDCEKLIRDFYQAFLTTPEGGDGKLKILLIDEIAGLLSHYSMSKAGKTIADDIRSILSSILMLGRSRECFLWLSMQRFTASIFPASSGAADNFHIAVGLGRLTVDGRRALFAGETLEGEEDITFSYGEGIVLIDGKPLKGVVLPNLSKADLLERLRGRYALPPPVDSS